LVGAAAVSGREERRRKRYDARRGRRESVQWNMYSLLVVQPVVVSCM
jgi:hypothetical protein